MTHKIIVIALVLSMSLTTVAQNAKPYNKKQTKEFVEKVKSLIAEQSYEQALFFVESSSESIIEKNIAKADRAWWTV